MDKYNFSETLIFFDVNNDYEFYKFTDIRKDNYEPVYYYRSSEKPEFQVVLTTEDKEFVEKLYCEYFNKPPLEEEVRFLLYKENEHNYAKLKGLEASELFNEELPPINWIIKDLIPAQGLTLLSAKKKVGKSWFSYELASAVASGGLFLGHKVEQGKVIYIDLEMSKQLIQDRLKKYFNDENKEHLQNLFIYTDNALTLKEEENGFNFVNQLEMAIKDFPGTSLIIIDTIKYIRTSSGRQDVNLYDTKEMKLLHDFCTKHPELTIVGVNHLNKQDTEDPFDAIQGSASVAASTDTNIVIQQKRSSLNGKIERILLHTQGRYAPEKSLLIKFEDFNWQIVRDINSEDSNIDLKDDFYENPLVNIILEILEVNNGNWKGKSKTIADKLKEKFNITKASQQISKEILVLKPMFQEFENIYYSQIKRKGNSVQHNFSRIKSPTEVS